MGHGRTIGGVSRVRPVQWNSIGTINHGGRSCGSRLEQAQAIINPQKIIAYGRSLGGGAAAILAGKRPTAGLLLESTFTSVRSFAHGFWLPEFVVLDPFDTLAVLSAYGGPVLVLHGKYDQVVPVHHAEELARTARHSELKLVPCGHNDCPSSWSTIRSFLLARGILKIE